MICTCSKVLMELCSERKLSARVHSKQRPWRLESIQWLCWWAAIKAGALSVRAAKRAARARLAVTVQLQLWLDLPVTEAALGRAAALLSGGAGGHSSGLRP